MYLPPKVAWQDPRETRDVPEPTSYSFCGPYFPGRLGLQEEGRFYLKVPRESEAQTGRPCFQQSRSPRKLLVCRLRPRHSLENSDLISHQIRRLCEMWKSSEKYKQAVFFS